METLKYKVIVNDQQYNQYCKVLEGLVFLKQKNIFIKEEIALLTLLIEKYDEQRNTLNMVDPITLLKSLMKEHRLKAVDLAKYLQVSEGLVSDMLKYKKGLSKETIRLLAEKFSLRQEAFNRDYALKGIKILGIVHNEKSEKHSKVVYD
jgi:HTH-type transcriptional regulator / antitoxin HigA